MIRSAVKSLGKGVRYCAEALLNNKENNGAQFVSASDEGSEPSSSTKDELEVIFERNNPNTSSNKHLDGDQAGELDSKVIVQSQISTSLVIVDSKEKVGLSAIAENPGAENMFQKNSPTIERQSVSLADLDTQDLSEIQQFQQCESKFVHLSDSEETSHRSLQLSDSSLIYDQLEPHEVQLHSPNASKQNCGERQMRSLDWKPIFTRKRKITNGLSKTSISSCAEIWKELEPLSLDGSLEEFMDLFSFPLRDCSPKFLNRKTIKVLDIKRSLNISIICRSMHVSIADIEHAIYKMDTSVVSADSLLQISRLKATKEELALIKDASEADIPLDHPEHFLLQLSMISSLSERIDCIVFQMDFNGAALIISKRINLIRQQCNFLKTNEDLKLLFAIILTLGNYMNGTDKQRGSAEGFNLDILGKLKSVKSNNRRTTLLHFIVRTYIKERQTESTQCFPMALPIPEPAYVERCAKEDFAHIRKKIFDLKERLKRCRNKASEVIYNSPKQALQPFKHNMEQFIRNAAHTVEKLDRDLDACLESFIETIRFYRYVTKSEPQMVMPAQFFEYWTNFCHDLKKIWKNETGLS